LIDLQEVLASESDELFVAWMVYDLVTNDAGGGMRAVFVRVVTEVRDRGMRARHQNFGDSVERIANLTEELVLSPDGTAMLGRVVSMRPDLLRHHMLDVELQNLSGLMVRPDDGVV
jgi:hypothetical protein